MDLLSDLSTVDPSRYGLRYASAYIAAKTYGPDSNGIKVEISQTDLTTGSCQARITRAVKTLFADKVALGELFALKEASSDNLETLLNLKQAHNLTLRKVPEDIQDLFDAGRPVPITRFLQQAIRKPLLLQAKARLKGRYSHLHPTLASANKAEADQKPHFDCSACSANQLGLRKLDVEKSMSGPNGRSIFMSRVMDYQNKGYLQFIGTNCPFPKKIHSKNLPLGKMFTGDVIIYADNNDITGFRHTVIYLFHTKTKKVWVGSQEGVGGEFRVTLHKNIIEGYKWPHKHPFWLIVRATAKHPHPQYIGGGK